jgi:hypothetical protein
MALARRTALLALALLPTGCVFCVTTSMWGRVDVDPVEIEGASIDEHGVLRLAVAYADGRTWVVSADLSEPGRDPGRGSPPVYRARCDGPQEEPLPPSTVPIDLETYPLDVGRVNLSLSTGGSGAHPEFHRVWVRGGGYNAYVDLPSWPDWESGDAYLALLASPFTVAFDLLFSPVYVLWLFWTVGGHGDPWLPWFR